MLRDAWSAGCLFRFEIFKFENNLHLLKMLGNSKTYSPKFVVKNGDLPLYKVKNTLNTSKTMKKTLRKRDTCVIVFFPSSSLSSTYCGQHLCCGYFFPFIFPAKKTHRHLCNRKPRSHKFKCCALSSRLRRSSLANQFCCAAPLVGVKKTQCNPLLLCHLLGTHNSNLQTNIPAHFVERGTFFFVAFWRSGLFVGY